MNEEGKKWFRFGEQVDLLIKTLAIKKHLSVPGATLHVVEQLAKIGYKSEASVRMMRQGRFRPKKDEALEILVRIGKQEAGLDREWAESLLLNGDYPNRKHILDEVYGKEKEPRKVIERIIERVIEKEIPPIYFFPLRFGGAMLGTLVLLGLWAFFINPLYPPPHELEAVMELVWGMFIGLGLAFGLFSVDIYPVSKGKLKWKRVWHYTALPFGGILGASLWHFGATSWFTPNQTSPIQSTSGETFTFGSTYALGVAILIFLLLAILGCKPWERPQVLTVTLTIALCGVFTLVVFLLVFYHPTLSNQQNIDIGVGLILRAGLALEVSICFPPLLLPQHYNFDKLTWLPWRSLYSIENQE